MHFPTHASVVNAAIHHRKPWNVNVRADPTWLLDFSVDGLDAGQTRAFEARLVAKRSGEFRSHATARADNLDLTARSTNTLTRVLAAELDTKVDGPATIYSEQPATYTAEVTNTGNQVARNVHVRVRWPAQSQLARLDDAETHETKGSTAKQNARNSVNQN